MDDRTLLELAAAAAACGMTINEALEKIGRPLSLYSEWNPLTDEGDALRLATYLRFTIEITNHEIEVFDNVDGECLASIPVFAQDIESVSSAVRRAIVCAAAAIGKRGKTAIREIAQ